MFKRIVVLLCLVGCSGGRGELSQPTVETTVRTDPPTTVVITAVEPPISVVQEATTTTVGFPDFDPVAYVEAARATYGKCGEWHDVALSVGWTEPEWGTLSEILWRESRCVPDAWNGHDAGLTQINQIHAKWLAEMGLEHPADMFDPRLNLWFAYRLYSSREEVGKCGWQPWSGTCN